eukprot:6160075-Prymnesium_polylepis.1
MSPAAPPAAAAAPATCAPSLPHLCRCRSAPPTGPGCRRWAAAAAAAAAAADPRAAGRRHKAAAPGSCCTSIWKPRTAAGSERRARAPLLA